MKLIDFIVESDQDPFDEDQLSDEDRLAMLQHRAQAVAHRIKRTGDRFKRDRETAPFVKWFSGIRTSPNFEIIRVPYLTSTHTTTTAGTRAEHELFLDLTQVTPDQRSKIEKIVRDQEKAIDTLKRLKGKYDRLRKKLANAVGANSTNVTASSPPKISVPGRPDRAFSNPAVVYKDGYAGPASLYPWPGKRSKGNKAIVFEFLKKYCGVDTSTAVVFAGKGRKANDTYDKIYTITVFDNGRFVWYSTNYWYGALYFPDGQSHSVGDIETYDRNKSVAVKLPAVQAITQSIDAYNKMKQP